MFTIILGVLAGVGLIIFRMKSHIDKSKDMKELFQNNTYQVFDNSKPFIIFLVIIGLLSTVSLVYSIAVDWNETNIALAALLVCLAVEGIINAIDSMKYYYNDTSVILGNKAVRYKSIKTIEQKRSPLPLKRYIVRTINGEEFTIPKKFEVILQEKMNQRNK